MAKILPGRFTWHGCLITISTAAQAAEPPELVRITHPFHPLFGQTIDFVDQRAQWGEDRVFYKDSLGRRASVPACWTSSVPDDPIVIMGAGKSQFRVQDLLDLAALIRVLR